MPIALVATKSKEIGARIPTLRTNFPAKNGDAAEANQLRRENSYEEKRIVRQYQRTKESWHKSPEIQIHN